METMVLCSTSRGISRPLLHQKKHLSDNKNIHHCKFRHSPFCLKQKCFTSGLRYRIDSPPSPRSTTSEEAWTETTNQSTSYVKDDSDTSEATSYLNDESKPAAEDTQSDSYLKDGSEPKPEPQPEAAIETTSNFTEEAKPKSEPEAVSGSASNFTEEPESKPEPETATKTASNFTDDIVINAEVQQESPSADDSLQLSKILEDWGVKLDSKDKYLIYALGASGVIALYVTSAILHAVDSIPLLPKVLELVGIGCSVWFSYRNLIFKEKRELLIAKIDQIKQEVIGSDED